MSLTQSLKFDDDDLSSSSFGILGISNSSLRGHSLKPMKNVIFLIQVNLVFRIELWSTRITYRNMLLQVAQLTHLRIVTSFVENLLGFNLSQ